jgi:low temperature requirement protein LtrA
VVVSLALLVIGGLVDGSARVWLWIAMVVMTFLGTVSAGNGEWIVRSGHFAERHGLILIIALGEVVVAIGIAVSGELGEGGLSNELWLTMLAAGALAGLLWWAYFDRVNPALEHRCDETDASARGRFARDVYTWAHAPIIAGIITAAAATEEILLHPGDELYQEFRIMFVIGLVLFFGGIAIAVYRAYRVLAFERLIGLAAIAVVMLAGGSLAGMWLLVAAVVIISVTLVAEHQRIEG